MIENNFYFPPPQYLLWEITLRCNFKCLHCAFQGGKARENELTTEEAILLCKEISKLKCPSVALMGGEPFLRKDWEIITENLRKYNINVGIITNGFLFDEKLAKKIEELGICQVGVSLDGAKAEIHDYIRGVKGAFEKVINAINIINSLNLYYKTVITSTNKYNINELDGILEILLKNTKNFTWIINSSSDHKTKRIVDKNWTLEKDNFIKLVDFINKNRPLYADNINITGTHSLGYFSSIYKNLYDFTWKGCLAGKEALGIRSNGDIVGCLILPEEFNEGNIRKESLVKIWNSEKSFPYTRKFNLRRLKGKCRICKYKRICKAGCTDSSYTSLGTIYEANFCLYYDERLRLKK